MKFLDDEFIVHIDKLQKGVKRRMKIYDIIHSILEQHAKGIKFREWKAGPEIDTNMESDGFNIELGLDHTTGFIIGGHYRNCLTWMDKMGSS